MPISINGSGTISGISVGGLENGCVNEADLATAAVTNTKLASNAVTIDKMGSAEQSGLCKAWVNFNGTGTVAIRASYNVSSITDNGAGEYTVNFAAALVDANYGVATYAAFSNNSVASTNVRGIGNCIKSAGSIRVQVIYYTALDGGATKQDEVEVNVSIHR